MMKAQLVGCSILTGLIWGAVVDVPVEAQPVSPDPVAQKILKARPVVPLPNQDYALCAGAITFNFDKVTYARCALNKNGNSISATQKYNGGNIKTLNTQGNQNGAFVMSTFSPPTLPDKYAAYSCKKTGAYAQCDGGICFESTVGKEFPGLGKLSNREIVCSCPIETSRNYHVWGPNECPTNSSTYDDICSTGLEKKNSMDGKSLRVGNNGPVAVSKALVDYYNIQFKTNHTLKTCSRP